MSSKEKIQELKKLEAEERAERVSRAAEAMQRIMTDEEVEFDYLAKAPGGGMVHVKDLLPPGWGFVANLVPRKE